MKIFLHGLDSSSQGTKAVFFRERYPDMLTPDFSGPLEERVQQLEGILSGTAGLRIVGSSFGGLMATVFAMQHESSIERMVLLAPAINLLAASGYPEKRVSVPVWVFHGNHDDVIPLRDARAVARRIFPHLTFREVEDDHNLHGTFRTFDWDMLLR
ncbi:MAG: alpha/beta hydrolase [Deltaproteobacteria bacterium]|nr:alpha/beta hydrolase [Deltaproteobacteria bacterium]